MDINKEYYAFISYKREDENWAKWLQRKLEHYRFPTDLNGRTDLPKNIRPTFRDETDLEPSFLAEKKVYRSNCRIKFSEMPVFIGDFVNQGA